jgi:hypothetical protein
VTDENQLEPLRESTPLNHVTQPLGFLPSMWFWNRPEHWRLVRWPFAGLAVLLILIVSLTGVPALAAGLLTSASLTLTLGLLERYIRAQAEAGRRLRAGTPDGNRGPLDA